jgi:hypothetical protein
MRAELSRRARLGRVQLLLASTATTTIVALLWLTEPALPARAAAAFAVMTVSGLGWMTFAVWMLTSQGRVRAIAAGALTACALGLPQDAVRQLREPRTQHITSSDGTVFELTTGFVRVQEQRGPAAGSDARTIDLAVARVRRAGPPATSPSSAHVILTGGPGDSGVDQVLGLARRGGAAMAALMSGDVDRLVLVSPEGLDHTWKLLSQVDVVLRRLAERGAGDVSPRSPRS